jgi:flagellar protein FlbD
LILLTQLNGNPIHVNADLIETLESTPDTVLTLTNGKKILVKESTDEVIARIGAYKDERARGVAIAHEVSQWT